MNEPDGITIVLHPFLVERIDSLDSVPILREELINFTFEMELLNPGIYFDYSVMNELERRNLWFIEVLSNHEL